MDKRPWQFEHALWLCVMAIGVHYLEEFGLDFVGWADRGLGLQITWTEFNWVNVTVLIVVVGSACVGWRAPALGLASPALLAINALLFHVPLSFVSRRYCPGAATSVLFFLPAAGFAYWGAYRDGVLTRRTVVISLCAGLFLQVYPFILLALRGFVH